MEPETCSDAVEKGRAPAMAEIGRRGHLGSGWWGHFGKKDGYFGKKRGVRAQARRRSELGLTAAIAIEVEAFIPTRDRNGREGLVRNENSATRAISEKKIKGVIEIKIK